MTTRGRRTAGEPRRAVGGSGLRNDETVRQRSGNEHTRCAANASFAAAVPPKHRRGPSEAPEPPHRRGQANRRTTGQVLFVSQSCTLKTTAHA